MVHMKAFLSLLPLVALVNAVVIPRHLEIHEKREFTHPRWTKRDRVESHKLFPMRIGLAQNNLDDGYEKLMDV
jgi:tripeptidyl-peptidase-1